MMNKYVKRSAFAFAAATIFFAGCQKTETISPDGDTDFVSYQSQVIPGQYIVTLNNAAVYKTSLEGLSFEEKTARMKADISAEFFQNAPVEEKVMQVYASSITGFAAKLTTDELSRLKADGRVLAVEPDQIVSLGKPSKPGKGGGGGGSTPPPQETPWGVTRVGGAVDGTGKTAWVIDSGVDMSHPDLNVDQNRSVSFLSGSPSNKSPNDQNGHGTHVAGTIAALDNSIGVVGVAAGATVVAVRVLDRSGSGSTSGVIAGIDYVAANGSTGDVANMSLGGGVSTALDNAVVAAAATGVKFALAAGNESDDADNHSPARAEGANIYTVSAMDINDDWAYFSNFGDHVDYCGPGVSILSTWKGGGYNTISGTSMATPHVAGLLLGSVTTDGYVNGDPDGTPDPIAHH